jgi:hypothetical protein
MNSFNSGHIEILFRLFALIFWIASSIWVYMDAKKIRKLTGDEKVKPLVWFLACIALWIFAFPIYVYYRFIKN